MPRVFDTRELKIFHGDAIEELKEIPDNRIDALVCDPPAGISFMGRSWDKDMGGRDNWIAEMQLIFAECLRVMKPGAHGLVWALPRTSHWTATALENAGFECRDICTHLFGSGFPKNMDVSKAIDKAAGAEREVVGDNPNKRNAHKQGARGFDKDLGDTPLAEMKLTAPATDEAKHWEGWGTALKPAAEYWILVRKPCSEKTVAANVLKWGTGAINIDGSRIKTSGEEIHIPQSDPSKRSGVVGTDLGISNADTDKFQAAQRLSIEKANAMGRWPANVVFSHSDDCKLVGETKAGSGKPKKGNGKRPGGFANVGADKGSNEPCGQMYGAETVDVYECTDDCPVKELDRQAEGASRFYYCPKPSRSEKEAGLGDRETKNVNDGRKTSIDNAYQRGDTQRKNTHPTVKPIKLMEYLCNLITPPGGIVLDPFLGSGTTGIAALNKGFRFVGIEREEEYLEIAQARLEHALYSGEIDEAA